MQSCSQCQSQFEITEEDLQFYKKIEVPPPTLCPEDRERRRLAWRNERHLYKRACGLCARSILSVFHETCSFPIYCDKCFWSDQWDARSYGIELDLNRSFFEQIFELAQRVPRLAITRLNSVNCDYTLNSIDNKNCYLTSGADYNNDCFYSINTQRNKDCSDCYFIKDSELSYGCSDSIRLYKSIGCQDCEGVSHSWFLFDCKNCQDCAFSSNLRNKRYVFLNQQYSPEEYGRKLTECLRNLFEQPDWLEKNIQSVRKNSIYPFAFNIQSENVSGNHILKSKNSHHVFDTEEVEDCKYVYYGLKLKDSYDMTAVGFDTALLYEIQSGTSAYDCKFCVGSWNVSGLQYCISCFHSKDCFGCISLSNHKEYCILNKQYRKEEYELLKKQLVEVMKKSGEYGEFFPASLCPYEYNRSAAYDYMPLSKNEALKRGFRWYEGPNELSLSSPDSLECKMCSKNYRLIKEEVALYERLSIPKPRFCWSCRAKKLIDLRPPRKLVSRNCMKCGVVIQTSYSHEWTEKVYCEKCYLEAVY